MPPVRSNPPPTHDEGWFTRERILTVALALMTLAALYACFLLVQPFLSAIVFALTLAVATQRPYRWLRARVQSDAAAAAIAVALVAILIVVPITVLGTYVVQEVVSGINELRAGGATLRSVIER